jgi:hypothetical protein
MNVSLLLGLAREIFPTYFERATSALHLFTRFYCLTGRGRGDSSREPEVVQGIEQFDCARFQRQAGCSQ